MVEYQFPLQDSSEHVAQTCPRSVSEFAKGCLSEPEGSLASTTLHTSLRLAPAVS